MKNAFFLILILLYQSVSAQMVEDFDGGWTTWYDEWMNDGNSLTRTYVTDNKIEGDASLKLEWVMKAEDWGGGISIARALGPGEIIDMSTYDTLQLSYYVEKPATNGNCYIALILRDNPVSSTYDADQANVELWRHQIHGVLEDNTPGWQTLNIPLKTVGNPLAPTSEDWMAGFNMQGSRHHNNKLDWDFIRGFYLEINTDSANHQDDGIIYLDNMKLTGSRATPLVLYNGKVNPNNVSFSVGWTGNAEITNEADFDNANTGSIKWTCGPDADGAGWDGIWFQLDKPHKLGELMNTDTFQIAIKAPTGFGDLWLAFADDDADGDDGPDRMYQSVYFLEEASIGGFTGDWQLIKIPLTAFEGFGSWDSDHLPGSVDSNRVIQFRVEGNGQNVEGKVVYFDNIWTGQYELDIIAPAAPQIEVFSGGDYVNIIAWEDVPGEKQEIYRVFSSTSPLSDLTAEGVEVVQFGISEGVQATEHALKFPLVDQDVTNYYAVVCIDNSGNQSAPGLSGAITNLAKGISVISHIVPINFAADGSLDEWNGIKPFKLNPTDGSGHIATNYVIDNESDLSADVYLAADAENLFVAFNVTDDLVSVDRTIGEWENDIPDLFIGLYNQTGVPHASYQRDDEPDYRLMFDRYRLLCGRPWLDSLILPGENYYWDERVFPSGYVVEAKIPWTLFTTIAGDQLFTPKVGMKIPLDITLNDADATGSREGMLSLSPLNNDDSYANVSAWSYTWYGDKNVVGVEDGKMLTAKFNLEQNYPNPFNPVTQINYSISKQGFVSLKIYNILGSEVENLISENQTAGNYTVTFDASKLASGVYMYKLETENFISTKKMILMK